MTSPGEFGIEQAIRAVLEDELGLMPLREWTIPGTAYRVDFYLPTQRVVIEHHGAMHDRPVFGRQAFEELRAADEAKREWLAKQGIKLVVLKQAHVNSEVRSSKLGKLAALLRDGFDDEVVEI